MTIYLIAHKVRGEPVYDIAEKMEVGEEVWWVIPTSGHRAYPYWDMPIEHIQEAAQIVMPPMPPDIPEHYEVSAAPKGKGKPVAGLLEKLGLVKPLEPAQSFKRREW